MEYTREQSKRIVAGLVSGKGNPPYRPMTDAEFEARYDPQGTLEKRKTKALENIAQTLNRLANEQLQERPPTPRPLTQTGHIEL